MTIHKKADPSLNSILEDIVEHLESEKGEKEDIEVNEDDDKDDDEPEHGSGVAISVEEGEEPKTFVFKLPPVPGSDLESMDDLVVEEPEDEVSVEERDAWDWGKLSEFMPWLQKMFTSVPEHSGTEISGVERAISYLESLERSISKAVKSDIKNELKIADVEVARDEIHRGIDNLEERLDQLNLHKKRTKKKKADIDSPLVKQAQKISGISGIVVTVPLLISRIARVCINGTVSAGHDMEKMMDDQIEKYKLTDREQAELLQLIEDMGYQVKRDRGYKRDEKIDLTQGKYDWSSQYPA